MKTYSAESLLVLLCSFVLLSCTKKGCTDPDSVNYNAEAKLDDGTCRYESLATFYIGQGAYDSLKNNGYQNLRLILNTEDLGVMNINNLKSNPDCSDTQSVIILDLNSNKSLNIPYEVKDEDTGKPLFKGEGRIKANSCNGIELKY